MVWFIEQTDQFAAWWEARNVAATAEQEARNAAGMTDDEVGPVTEAVNAMAKRIEHVAQAGPAEKRPAVGKLENLKVHHHLKEMRIGSYRTLFGFGPNRNDLPGYNGAMILLLGADKAEHGWTKWYATAVPEAEDLYSTYLYELTSEGKID